MKCIAIYIAQLMILKNPWSQVYVFPVLRGVSISILSPAWCEAEGVNGYQPNDVMIPSSAPVTCTIFSVSFYPSDRLTTFITLCTNRVQVKWNIMLILRGLPTNIDWIKVSSATNFCKYIPLINQQILIFPFLHHLLGSQP